MDLIVAAQQSLLDFLFNKLYIVSIEANALCLLKYVK